MTLYEKIIQAPQTIGWMDLISDARKKHTKQDVDYSFIAGTTLDSANRDNMLLKWQKPWLFYRALVAGVILVACMYGLRAVLNAVVGGEIGYEMFIAFIVPMVVPVVLMIFFWELNVPRNISVIELLGGFLFGAAVCFFVTYILMMVFPGVYVDFDLVLPGTNRMLYEYDNLYMLASDAPLREEPAKLVATILILWYFAKKSQKQIYGFTGLAVGAVVGAAFSAYESVKYGIERGTDVVLLRAVLAVGGHVLFCAPYGAALALHMKDNKLTLGSFLNKDFLFAFILSNLMHALWNADLPEYLFYLSKAPGKFGEFQELTYGLFGNGYSARTESVIRFFNNTRYLKLAIVTVILWMSTRSLVRKCFRQVGETIHVQTVPAAGTFHIVGTSGFFAGKSFSVKSSEIFVGTDSSCKLCYPMGTAGIDPKHSELLIRGGYLYLADLGTSGGTYINGAKIPSGKGHLLRQGDTFWIGSQQEAFRVM